MFPAFISLIHFDKYDKVFQSNMYGTEQVGHKLILKLASKEKCQQQLARHLSKKFLKADISYQLAETQENFRQLAEVLLNDRYWG